MRDWFGVYFGVICSWAAAAIDWNGITIVAACVASIATGIITIVCGIQKIAKGRSERLAESDRHFKEECEAILARNNVCDKCISNDGSLVEDCTFIHRHKNCPKN